MVYNLCRLMKFIDKLLVASRKNNSLLCVGLDPDPELIPGVDLLEFNRAIIDATSDLVCAYKPNLAFYEALGIDGLKLLVKTLEHIPKHIPVIADGKRGDIGNTARAYARALFSTFGFDAATVNPYLGTDCIEPFASYKDKGVFILCRTSNPGALDFQNLRGPEGVPLYKLVARKALEWNANGNIGLVMGATYPEELMSVRKLCPDMPLLIPGIGPQGGDLTAAVRYGIDKNGEKAIIVAARQVLYATPGGEFATAARKAALGLRDRINELIPEVGRYLSGGPNKSCNHKQNGDPTGRHCPS